MNDARTAAKGGPRTGPGVEPRPRSGRDPQAGPEPGTGPRPGPGTGGGPRVVAGPGTEPVSGPRTPDGPDTDPGAEAAAPGAGPEPRRRVELDPDSVERDLARLVLTVIELLRQLMERQALRRVEDGDLTEDQEERIGTTLMLLEDRMEILRTRFGLEPEDLNIDLGPLGPL
ncbi:gas vesicle protein K, partial [Streptomyces fradiae]